MKTPIQLQQQNLEELGSRIPVPIYNRMDNKIGIVHVGVGKRHFEKARPSLHAYD